MTTSTSFGRATVIIIGAGHSGLAMSHCLSVRGVDHLILERSRPGHSWSERWHSLRLLTPNWQTRLPGMVYDGSDPDGFMTAGEVHGFITRYAELIRAPVVTGVNVESVVRDTDGYRIDSNAGEWCCKAVVIATGACNSPLVPAISEQLPDTIVQWDAHRYRHPGQLPGAPVLVVGASATGLQLAEEIHRSGRPVTLSVGEHVRMVRRYRGRDIQYWLHAMGILDERYDQIDDLPRSRQLPSPQLVGDDDGRDLDLNTLQIQGVRVAGRLAGISGSRALFSGGLANVCALADLKLNRLLGRIDQWIADSCPPEVRSTTPESPVATRIINTARLQLDLHREGIGSVVWATGFRPDYSWLKVPVLDGKGRLKHDGGVLPSPGLYVLGLPFLRRRKSSFIHGAEDDARDLSEHLVSYLQGLSNVYRINRPDIDRKAIITPGENTQGAYSGQPGTPYHEQGIKPGNPCQTRSSPQLYFSSASDNVSSSE